MTITTNTSCALLIESKHIAIAIKNLLYANALNNYKWERQLV